MKSIDRIPTGKIERASKLVQTGVKLGGNYLKHYGEKLINPELDRSKLDEANAAEIYNTLKSLKGSALKMAQMLSMEKNVLPQAYVDKFALSQFSVPPLSPPLVTKTFRQYFGQSPLELFDHFDAASIAAASIGQVHKAHKDGRELAVKIQYPGVAESISSDLAIVKPIALKMFDLQAADVEHYFQEVKSKLLEETDYTLELRQGTELAAACGHLPGMRFPNYYPQWSSSKILTMDWMHGQHLSEFVASDASAAARQAIGQRLWDFYMFQVNQLQRFHADPHPGNFLISPAQELIAIDFGCIKALPADFHQPYFELIDSDKIRDAQQLQDRLEALAMFKPEDTPAERDYITGIFQEMLLLITRPFGVEHFDFADAGFFEAIATLGEKYSRDPVLRKLSRGRGSQHFLYVNRTFFGLYQLLHDLQAEVITRRYWPA
ncbi:MAG: AarF/ABC1/UbiB kinase family protein [Candidatus Sericytochromatia bacterium]|nr:AarF/ABC1/UbiB kinase family protein [Candidatus Sericytochromatia bacterium]